MLTIFAMHRAARRREADRVSGNLARSSWLAVGTLAMLALALPLPAAAASWSGKLENGGEIRVDPRTNRPTVTIDGRETQLWDGVHKLQDGSKLTVESGRVTPNEEMIESRQPHPVPPPPSTDNLGEPILGLSPCERLVRKVCGTDEVCANAKACGPALPASSATWSARNNAKPADCNARPIRATSAARRFATTSSRHVIAPRTHPAIELTRFLIF